MIFGYFMHILTPSFQYFLLFVAHARLQTCWSITHKPLNIQTTFAPWSLYLVLASRVMCSKIWLNYLKLALFFLHYSRAERKIEQTFCRCGNDSEIEPKQWNFCYRQIWIPNYELYKVHRINYERMRFSSVSLSMARFNFGFSTNSSPISNIELARAFLWLSMQSCTLHIISFNKGQHEKRNKTNMQQQTITETRKLMKSKLNFGLCAQRVEFLFLFFHLDVNSFSTLSVSFDAI